MNGSTFQMISYMNGSGFFFKDRVYDWGRFRNTGSHTCTKIAPKLPPPPPPPPPISLKPRSGHGGGKGLLLPTCSRREGVI